MLGSIADPLATQIPPAFAHGLVCVHTGEVVFFFQQVHLLNLKSKTLLVKTKVGNHNYLSQYPSFTQLELGGDTL